MNNPQYKNLDDDSQAIAQSFVEKAMLVFDAGGITDNNIKNAIKKIIYQAFDTGIGIRKDKKR